MNSSTKPFTILLVEDEKADANLFKIALARNGTTADLHYAVDGREALEFLRREGPRFSAAPRPDLVLLDLNMPRMDGRECLAALKQDEVLLGIPVVVLTTSEVESDIVACYSLGAAGYVTKPVSIEEYVAGIKLLCEYWIDLQRVPGRVL
jgi:CheY-like chemotaxis protein